MVTLQVTLTDEQIGFINEQIKKGGLKNIDEFFADLLFKEQRRQAEDEFEKLIQESIDSGEPEEITEQWLNELKADFNKIHLKRKAS